LIAPTRNDLYVVDLAIKIKSRFVGHTNGRNALCVRVIAYVSCTTGANCSILGYMSNGEIVPDVITTLLKRSKTGLIASEGSRQL